MQYSPARWMQYSPIKWMQYSPVRWIRQSVAKWMRQSDARWMRCSDVRWMGESLHGRREATGRRGIPLWCAPGVRSALSCFCTEDQGLLAQPQGRDSCVSIRATNGRLHEAISRGNTCLLIHDVSFFLFLKICDFGIGLWHYDTYIYTFSKKAEIR